MKPHMRVLLFTTVIVVSPLLYLVGDRVGGTALALSLPGIAIAASFLYAQLGQGAKPPRDAGAP
jgi:hypothetical protein